MRKRIKRWLLRRLLEDAERERSAWAAMFAAVQADRTERELAELEEDPLEVRDAMGCPDGVTGYDVYVGGQLAYHVHCGVPWQTGGVFAPPPGTLAGVSDEQRAAARAERQAFNDAVAKLQTVRWPGRRLGEAMDEQRQRQQSDRARQAES